MSRCAMRLGLASGLVGRSLTVPILPGLAETAAMRQQHARTRTGNRKQRHPPDLLPAFPHREGGLKQPQDETLPCLMSSSSSKRISA
jgi:hypothetical protein